MTSSHTKHAMQLPPRIRRWVQQTGARLFRRATGDPASQTDCVGPVADPSPAARRVFCLVGAFGQPNLGDEIILRTWLRAIAAAHPGAVVHALGFDPQFVTLIQPRLPIDLRPSGLLWGYAHGLSSAPQPPGPADELLADRPELGPRHKLLRDYLLTVLSSAELVHFVGGMYISDRWPSSLYLPAVAAAAVRANGGRLAFTGIGFEPLDPGVLARIAPALRAADTFDLRDGYEADALRAAGRPASVTADDTLLEPWPAPAIGRSTDDPRCLVCIQQSFQSASGYNQLAGRVADLIGRLHAARPRLRVQVLEFSPFDDGQAADRLRRPGGPEIEVLSFKTLWSRFDEVFSPGEVVGIGTRFHFSVFCSRAGIPFVPIAVDPLYARKHAGLTETVGCRPAISAESFDPAVEAAYLLDNWGREVRRDDLINAGRARKHELFATLYGVPVGAGIARTPQAALRAVAADGTPVTPATADMEAVA